MAVLCRGFPRYCAARQSQAQVRLRGAKDEDVALDRKAGGRSGGGLFDGLEDEDDTAANKSDLFVPRSSVKKLVLKPKSSGTPNKSNPVTFAQADTTHNITNDEDVLVAASNEESVAFPPLKDKNQVWPITTCQSVKHVKKLKRVPSVKRVSFSRLLAILKKSVDGD